MANFKKRSKAEVSIHAPTRGATAGPQKVHAVEPVSIHAPTRGATKAKAPVKPAKRFQSTHPRGVRQCRATSRTAA